MLLSESPPSSKKHSTPRGSSVSTSTHKTTSGPSSKSATGTTATGTTPRPLLLSPLLSSNSTCRSGSTLSLNSNSSTTALIPEDSRLSFGGSGSLKSSNYHQQQPNYHHHQSHHSFYGSGDSGVRGTSRKTSSSSSSSASSKRGKKSNWGSRERAGMSFLIVIAFFAIFGLIILTELFMIDEKTHGGMMVLRHGNQGNRLGDSMPDYDNVKDDYDLLDDRLLSDNKLGFVQFRDSKLKIQDASLGDAGRSGQAGVLLNSAANGFGVGGNSVPIIPWGKVLPSKIEETLPRYPIGTSPTDGSWQVVNGTRFKFFVFSAYYDRRDGAKLVRVVGATKTRGPERVWCRFWYVSRHNASEARTPRYTSATVMARVKIIRENWNLKYSACFVLCPIRSTDVDVPQYVSIVSRLRAPPGNILDLRNTDWDPDFAEDRSGHQQRTVNSSAATVNLSASSASEFSALPAGDQIADKIAICVKPFHFNYDQALYLMEYLEFYTLMGVSHFTFYNHTTGPHATCVLRHYMSGDVPDLSTAWDPEYNPTMNTSAATSSQQPTQDQQQKQQQQQQQQKQQQQQQKQQQQQQVQQQQQQQQQEKPTKKRHLRRTNYVKPTINIFPWNLRMRSQKEIRTEGLFAALNDCLYRTMYRYKYLALVDLDEFIIPRHNDTLNELINSLNQRFRNRNTGAYSFQNAFFYLQFADDPFVFQEPEKSLNPRLRSALVTQRKTRRRFKLHPQKQRSKYICKPEAVIEAGNHFVWEFLPGKGSLNVPPTDAILHHYRVCEFGGNDCIKAPSTIDRTATKYVNRLVQRVNAVYNYLKEPCELPELPVMSKQQQPKRQQKQQQSNGVKSTQQQQQTQEHQPHKSQKQQLNQKETNQEQKQRKNLSQQQRQQQQPQQPQQQTKEASNTKIFNDFKTKLKQTEKLYSINEKATNTTTMTTNAALTPSSWSTEDSAAKSADTEYDEPNRIVVFEKDADGRTVVRVKYADS